MANTELQRILAFDERFTKAQATQVIDLPFGYAVLQDQFPLSHYHNRIASNADAAAPDLIAAADEVLGGAGCKHRYVTVDGEPSEDLISGLKVAGYSHDPVAIMIYSGNIADIELETDRPTVHAVSFDTIRPSIVRDWQVELPKASDEALRQLVERTVLYERGAELVRLATFDGDEVAGHADLYIDGVDHIAQFESLVTHSDYRGDGHGGALIQDAMRRADEVDTELFFLTADVDDWPYGWYQRLGFVEIARTHEFSYVQHQE